MKARTRVGFAFLAVLFTIAISSVGSATNGPLSVKNGLTIDGLRDRAQHQSVNVLVYDNQGRITNEFHSDGLEVTYEYSGGKMARSSDNRGFVQRYQVQGNRIEVTDERNGRILSKRLLASHRPGDPVLTAKEKRAAAEKKLAEAQSGRSSITPMSTTVYEDYWVNGVLMNDICQCAPNHATDKFLQTYTNMTPEGIQQFFVQQNSILKDLVEIWRMNSSGTVYDTHTTISPSSAIYNASGVHDINPKVIIATLQKESTLVTSAPGTEVYSSRRFYYAMAWGATDGGDIAGTSGFDLQIDKGTELLYDGWIQSPISMPALNSPINGGQTVTSNGVTYNSYIWIKNWGTWSLYNYTPWALDTSKLPTIGGGNYLFDQVFKMFWGTNWD